MFASSDITVETAFGRFRCNMPDSMLVIVLEALVVDQSLYGGALCRVLLIDAFLRVIRTADLIGIRSMLLLALSDEARGFYEWMGSERSLLDSMMLVVTFVDLKASVSSN